MLHTAEDVLPGHPDRLADAIAEALVDEALAVDQDALVGVEVAVNSQYVFITGRIAASPPLSIDFSGLVSGIYRNAGYRDRWEFRPQVDTKALFVTPLDDEERAIRGYSDDQNIITGYALNNPRTGYFPPALYVVRCLRRMLVELRERHADLFGPDGKILVVLKEEENRFFWQRCNVVLQHDPRVGYEDFYRLISPLAEQIDLVEGWNNSLLRINGCGDFSIGGPMADNGLSGKKLVVDHYGPGVPIGGGALCGKDPHKVDRIGPLQARQLAVKLILEAGAKEALVTLGYLPGLQKPDFISATVDGKEWTEEEFTRAVHVPDLSIEGTFQELDLAQIKWRKVAQKGYFGNGWAWEE
jgi:S-adenosylmethionine synthetase